jgi:hypothetical protein
VVGPRDLRLAGALQSEIAESGAWAGAHRGAAAGALPQPPDVAAGKSVGPEPDDREQDAAPRSTHWAGLEPCTRAAVRSAERSSADAGPAVLAGERSWLLRGRSLAEPATGAPEQAAPVSQPRAVQFAEEHRDAVAQEPPAQILVREPFPAVEGEQ